MTDLIVEISKYLMTFLFALYAYECFSSFRGKLSDEKRQRIFKRQMFLMYLIHLDAYLAIYAVTDDIEMILFYVVQVAFAAITISCYRLIYPRSSGLLVNNMCMLLMLGFIMLTRLAVDKAYKQFAIAVGSMVLTLVIPVLIQKVKFLRRVPWLYAVIGILGLAVVLVLGATSSGAKISIAVFGIGIQPSEFIKILFVFFIACMLYEKTDFKRVCITTVLAAAHVLILVCSRDLGGALIFFIAYLVMLYVATRKLFYFAGGILAGCIAAVVAYNLFAHVRVRVLAWKDPLSVIEDQGYQISQSLFAIGTGGWFGMGLYQGMPEKIPVVEQDFIFSAIAEELGGIFALCLLMVCVSCFLMFFNVAMQMKEQFYKLIALGLGTVYGFQVFLTVGGAVKFIPSTGVTLPLVSYGGSSLLATMIVFAIVQGLYILRQDEGNVNEKRDGTKQRQAGTRRQHAAAKRRKTGFDEEIEDFS